MKDFIASLNGRDRVFNADALFAKCDRFFQPKFPGIPVASGRNYRANRQVRKPF
ncbi:hypothetical protein IE990_29105 [Klebsiella pneumoniae]|uniref:Uncharacterized protein n=1 Tax=Klebsiella pneumoniae TaxID=573 RepID=A0A927DHG1_KLEPN|nr:hypothetical protein [Klebsiella pneumoniae]